MKLEVPYFKQTTQFNCAPAALGMVLHYFGNKSNLEDLGKRMGIEDGKAISTIKKNNITHLHICDALLAPLGNRIKKKTNVKTSITVHGLDITYPKKWYQKN